MNTAMVKKIIYLSFLVFFTITNQVYSESGSKTIKIRGLYLGMSFDEAKQVLYKLTNDEVVDDCIKDSQNNKLIIQCNVNKSKGKSIIRITFDDENIMDYLLFNKDFVNASDVSISDFIKKFISAYNLTSYKIYDPLSRPDADPSGTCDLQTKIPCCNLERETGSGVIFGGQLQKLKCIDNEIGFKLSIINTDNSVKIEKITTMIEKNRIKEEQERQRKIKAIEAEKNIKFN